MRHYDETIYPFYRGRAMATEQVWSNKSYELPLEEMRKLAPDMEWKYLPVIAPTLSPVEACQIIGEWYRACSSDARRVAAGQFFSPSAIAHYMAHITGELENGMHILDPGAGIGILTSAICEKALQQKIRKISVTCYESDPILYVLCRWVLARTQDILNEYGIDISIELYQRDFVEAMAEKSTSLSLWSQDAHPKHSFDLVILNPPYFKVNQKDPRAYLVKEIAQGRTNMYTIFMSLAASTLTVGGRFVSITPRSFASGAYFKHFRQQFFNTIEPELIHIFDSRRSAFEEAEVLQENIILSGTKKGVTPVESPFVIISRSHGLDDLTHPLMQQIQRRYVVDSTQKDPILHLPTSDIDMHLLQAFKRWNNSLTTYGLEISTGPIVPFRALNILTDAKQVEDSSAVPLLWLQHIRRMNINWPLGSFNKPQAVLLHEGQKQLTKNVTQIILRRFSAKEDPRRITAAVLSEKMFGTDVIALENHLNYLYRPTGTLSYEEAVGLAAFLNS
jgi:adenine-specific DNA-methyltransferase